MISIRDALSGDWLSAARGVIHDPIQTGRRMLPLTRSPTAEHERAGSGFRLTRRVVLSTLGFLILHPRLALADDEVSGIDDAPQILTILADLFLPRHGDNPGALALGIDKKLLDSFYEARRRKLVLRALIIGLGGKNFLSMDREKRERWVREKLEDGPIRLHLELVLDASVSEYYADPRSWGPIGYQTPQPRGYPDYADCRDREGSRAET